MKEFFFQTREMTVGYDGKPLIRDIQMQLQRGEILTLAGPNGAGKSTILKSIAGQLALIGGTVFFEGNALSQMTEKQLAKRMSLLLTDRVRPQRMTCYEVASMGRYPYTGRMGVLTPFDREKVREAMEQVRVYDLRDKEFLEVSDGEKQRVMLARAFCQEPQVLVLDEPTSHLDMKHKLDFLSILQQMTRKKKLAVILSLHEIELAQRVSDRVMCVKGPYIHRTGTPEEIFREDYISSLFGMETGSFDEVSGSPELPAVLGKPRVFVIAGGGTGSGVYRRLQREGVPFSTGILGENDRDYPVAKALAVRVISQKAYRRVDSRLLDRAKQEITECPQILCCLKEFGELNEYNRELLEFAHEAGKEVWDGKGDHDSGNHVQCGKESDLCGTVQDL